MLLLLLWRPARRLRCFLAFESLEVKIKGIYLFVEVVGGNVSVSGDGGGRGGRRGPLNGHSSGCWFLRILLKIFKLAGRLEGLVEGGC